MVSWWNSLRKYFMFEQQNLSLNIVWKLIDLYQRTHEYVLFHACSQELQTLRTLALKKLPCFDCLTMVRDCSTLAWNWAWWFLAKKVRRLWKKMLEDNEISMRRQTVKSLLMRLILKIWFYYAIVSCDLLKTPGWIIFKPSPTESASALSWSRDWVITD